MDLWTFMYVMMAVIVVMSTIYHHILLLRVVSLFIHDDEIIKDKRLQIPLWAVSVILAILTAYLFSTPGIILIHIVVISLIVEIINLILKKAGGIGKSRIWGVIYKSLIIPVLITACILTYGYVNMRDIVCTKYDVKTLKQLPKEELRVLFFADSHYGDILKSEGLFVLKERLEKEEPDILILTGDIVDEYTSAKQMREIFAVMGSVKSTYGTYYVYGNHDRGVYGGSKYYTEKDLDDAISQSGIIALSDTSTQPLTGVTLIGREDASAKDTGGRADLEQLLDGVDKDDYIIMADHQPLDYDDSARLGIDLLISGHTHGGQIWPSELFMNLFHMADQIYGEKKIGLMEGIVTSGLAGWGYPFRTGHSSEYVLVLISHNR